MATRRNRIEKQFRPKAFFSELAIISNSFLVKAVNNHFKNMEEQMEKSNTSKNTLWSVWMIAAPDYGVHEKIVINNPQILIKKGMNHREATDFKTSLTNDPSLVEQYGVTLPKCAVKFYLIPEHCSGYDKPKT